MNKKIVSCLAVLSLALAGVAGAAVAQGTQTAPGLAVAAVHIPVCPPGQPNGSARCHARVVVDQKGQPQTNPFPLGYGTTQFRTAYGLAGVTAGANQIIGIVDAYDDPTIINDLAAYNNAFGLPIFPTCTTEVIKDSVDPCFQKVNQLGQASSYPAVNSGWALEISLDVEVAHAVCPNCKILLVEAKSNQFADLLAAEDMAYSLGATVISNSWGGSESRSETSYDSHFNKSIPITVSSGDSGYGAEYPAASQYVTAVGGTTLNLNADSTRSSETVWSGSGSGCSAYEPKPSFQKDKGCAKRMIADVSADADPATGAAVYDTTAYSGKSGWFKVGGTSLSAPLIAAVYALAGNSGSISPSGYPYSRTAGLSDIVSGSNGRCPNKLTYYCNAVVGYDGPTGLGTPIGVSAF